MKDEVWDLFGVSLVLEDTVLSKGSWSQHWGGLLCNTFIIANYRQEEEEAPGKGAGSELWEVAEVVVAAAEDAGANE